MHWGRLAALLGACIAASQLSAAQGPANPPGKRAYVDFAMRNDGDPSRGRILFSNEQKAACIKCHSVDDRGAGVGPNLSAVGEKFPRRELIRSVLEPSATIAIGYGTTIVETKEGDDLQGIIKQATGTYIELVGADAKPIRIQNSDIKEQRTSEVSLMPEGLETGLTLQEFADLIAYLETLKQPAMALAVARGMPATIPPCANPLELRPFFDATIHLTNPVWFAQVPGFTNRFIVLEHFGQSWVIERLPNGDSQETLVDLTKTVRRGGGTGLLGMAFHPRFRENRKYYLKYHLLDRGTLVTLVVERRFSEDFKHDDAQVSPREIVRIPTVTQDHNGGCVTFGPDGFLYIGAGDSGPQNDPQGHGQDPGSLLGKMLRIDVDHQEPGHQYAVPGDNPFRDRAGIRPEIWALGFREPWRFTFDSVTKDLWVGDVGQDRYEEVGIVRRGENHGWNVYEGFTPFSNAWRRENEQYVAPVASYSHAKGVSVTGGYVYRGKRAPRLYGHYIFADFETRRVWALTQTNRVLSSIVEIGRAPTRAVSFAEDADGELYLVGYDLGLIYRLVLDHVDPTPLQSHELAETSERQATQWRYTLETPPSNWMSRDFNDTNWKVSPGGFGTRGTPGAAVRTDWRTSDIWLRRRFELPPNFANSSNSINLRVHHDEDAEVYLNGVEAARLPRWTTGYTDVPLANAAAHALKPGTNTISIHCHQVTGGQYIDAGLVEYTRAND